MQNTIITACGSGKYRALIHGITDGLSKKGFIVLPPPLLNIDALTPQSPYDGKLVAWKGATLAHLSRIHKADVCIMVNPGAYLGPSSTLELGCAVTLGKLVIALEHDPAELAREGLFDIVLGTSEVERVVEMVTELLRPKSI